MKKIGFLVIVLLSAVLAVQAQNYTFKVLASKGTNEVKTGGSWQVIKTGASLNTGDELKLAENSYLGLVHASGKPMELKQSGNYKIADLAAKMNGGTSVLNKYTDFILSSNSAEAKKNRLSATGAVHRDVGDKQAIELYLPENQFSGIFGNKVILNWEDKGVGPYAIELQNMFEDVLAKYETTATSYTIDLTDPKLADKEVNAIMVKVSSVSDPKKTSIVKMIKKLPAEEDKKVRAALGEMENDLSEESAINKFFLANFYEQNNLLVDAITAYQEAIKLEPSFQEAYDEFLLRKSIKTAKQQ
jgi:hypothetical protein